MYIRHSIDTMEASKLTLLAALKLQPFTWRTQEKITPSDPLVVDCAAFVASLLERYPYTENIVHPDGTPLMTLPNYYGGADSVLMLGSRWRAYYLYHPASYSSLATNTKNCGQWLLMNEKKDALGMVSDGPRIYSVSAWRKMLFDCVSKEVDTNPVLISGFIKLLESKSRGEVDDGYVLIPLGTDHPTSAAKTVECLKLRQDIDDAAILQDSSGTPGDDEGTVQSRRNCYRITDVSALGSISMLNLS